MIKTENSILEKAIETHEDKINIQETCDKNILGEDVDNGNQSVDTENNAGIKSVSNINVDDTKNVIELETEVKDVVNLTASLWQYKTVPEGELEPFPEYLTRYDKKFGVEMIGARVRGKKHKHEGTNCDDWFEYEVGEKVTCIAVSDGAGSKKYSRIGARSACKSAVGYLKSTFNDLFHYNPEILSEISLPIDDVRCIEACKKIACIVQNSMITAYTAVESAYYERLADKRYSELLGREIGIKDFSSTLLIAVCIPTETNLNEKLVISCQIGDGMIALFSSNADFYNSVKLIGEVDCGDFSGETDFLVNKNLLNRVSLASRTKVSRGCSDLIMLMSDGVADDYFPNESEMHRLYLDLVANGILDDEKTIPTNDLSSREIEIIKNIPKPLEYPWVNDKSVVVGLNDTQKIISDLNISLKELWDNKDIAFLGSVQVKEKMNTEDPAQRLKIWLDNYVARGSFDDRTLVVARI